MVARTSGNPNDFCLPDLGEGLEEAELVEWCVNVGQRVRENDVLAKMETAKALVEVPSPRDGVVAQLHGKPGQAIKVGSPLVTYKDETPEPEAAAPRSNGGGNGAPREERQDAGTVVGNLATHAESEEQAGKALAAPAVRRLARELGVNLDHVTGTGIGGRITASDVRAAVDQAPAHEPPAPSKRESAEQPAPAGASPFAETDRIPFRGVRRTIAEHLRYSVNRAVHFTVMDEADVTALDELRRRLVAASNEKVSLLPFVAAAVCRVLTGRNGPQFRRLNSTVDDDRQEIVQHRAVHLGVATDTESGLMVPVIRNANQLGVLEISRQIAEVAREARDRTIPPHRLTGSTFTISNFGAMGGRFGTPIINYPEAAVLAVGRAREGVVVRHGMIGVGKVLPLSLSADHRVIDGATAATALARIIELLQTPDELLPPG
ncbi:MAG TPA: dihydrolipoamide acetyltransferase family protein [Tepidisphaeraceae bacterium]|jgi:pyruvate dehydrogenase E2 component (dihydrolipoamide acetyltransferase)